MWLIACLLAWLMAGKPYTELIFSANDARAWPRVSAHGTLLGTVKRTPIAPETPGCYGMGCLADGIIWLANEHAFYTLDPTGKPVGGIIAVETIAGQSDRHLYRIRMGAKLPTKMPAVAHATVLEEIDPRSWTITRTWALPGDYESYGLGHLAVNPDETVAYYTKAKSSGTVRRHDLVSGETMTDLVARQPGSGGLLALTGSVLVGYVDGVQRIATDGSLLRRYATGPLRAGQGLLASGADSSTFWVQGLQDVGDQYVTMYEFDVETGNMRHEWPLPKNGVKWDAPFVDPASPSAGPRGSIVATGLNYPASTRAPWQWLSPTGTRLPPPAHNPTAVDEGMVEGGLMARALPQEDGSIYEQWLESSIEGARNIARFYNPGFQAVADITYAVGLSLHGSWVTDTYNYVYVGLGGPPNSGTLYWYSPDGTLVGSRAITGLFESFGGAARSVRSFTISPDESKVYLVGSVDQIYVAPLPSGAQTVFVTLPINAEGQFGGQTIMTLPGGSTDVFVAVDYANPFDSFEVFRYSAAGVLLHRYVINTDPAGSFVGIWPDLDGTTFWVANLTATQVVNFKQVRVSDGAFLHEFSRDGAVDGFDWANAAYGVSKATMACPDPCADAGKGVPYYALAPEQNTVLFYDRAFTSPPINVFSAPKCCQLASDSRGVWVCLDDDVGGTSLLFLVDPSTPDDFTGEAQILRGPIPTEVRIGELGASRALYVMDCDTLLTSRRVDHTLISICLPKALTQDEVDAGTAEGTAFVKRVYSLVNDPIDGFLVDSGKNFLYVAGGVAALWDLTNDVQKRVIGAVEGTKPWVTNDNTFWTYTGLFLNGTGDFMRYKRSGGLVRRYGGTQPGFFTFSLGVWSFVVDLVTDVCECGNGKDGDIAVVGKDNPQALPISVLDGSFKDYVQLTDVVHGGIDTAAAFIVINHSDGSGFSDQSGRNVRRPTPNRHCGPETRLTTVQPNSGCNAGGNGWTPTYTGPSGVVPTCSDPPDEEAFTGKSTLYPFAEHRHASRPSGAVTTIRTSVVELDDVERKEGRIKSIGDVEIGLSDAQGNFISATINIEQFDVDGRPYATRLGSATEKYFQRDELFVKAISDIGRRNGATPRAIGRGIVNRYPYGGMQVFGLNAIDPLMAEGGGFGPDKRIPQFNYPTSYYTEAPPDLSKMPLPIIFGEVSDEGAVNKITGLPNSRGLCPARFVGMDVLGTMPGGANWGRFNICGHAVYKVVALYGSDLGALGLYGQNAVASLVDSFDSGSEDGVSSGGESTLISLDGSPDLSQVATDGNAQIVVFADSGRTELQINAVDNFGKSVTVDGTIDPDVVAGVSWYISSIDYVPRRVKIDLATRNGVDVNVPTWAGFTKATSYQDFTSTEGDYRVTDMWAIGPLLAAHLIGEVTLALNMIGIEDKGDGTGLPIYEFFTAYNFFLDNFLHRQLRKPLGNYWPQLEADVPLWSDGFSKTKQSRFRAVQDQTVEELGGVGLEISAYFGENTSTRDADQLFQNNGHCRTGVDEHGRMVVWRFNAHEDASAWPRLDHVSQVQGDITFDPAIDEAMNWVFGEYGWDPDASAFRGDGDMKSVSQEAIDRNEGIVRYSKHYDGKLIAKKEHFKNMLDRVLMMHQDGPQYVTIANCAKDAWDFPIGTGILFTSQFGPSALGWVDQPLIVLRKTLHLQAGSETVTLICLNVGPGSAPGDTGSDSLLIDPSQQFVLTNDPGGPTLSDDESIAPVLAA